MSNENMKFIDLCLNGSVDPLDIDDFIQCWHESEVQCTIEDYLGLTKEEYAYWVEEPHAFRYILFSRKYKMLLSEAISWNTHEHNIAARGPNLEEVEIIKSWLQRTERI